MNGLCRGSPPLFYSTARHSNLNRSLLEQSQVNPKIKQVFCSTHTIDESKYVGDWLDTLKGYERRDPEYLNKCKSEVSEGGSVEVTHEIDLFIPFSSLFDPGKGVSQTFP